ncbi:MAG: YjbE family putative metal transport protein [Alphaproteobacteria bacterium]
MIFGNSMDIVQIIFAYIILSGDNALVIGMAACGLSPELRKKAIFYGMAMAAGLRIVFATVASLMISVPGILFAGGLLLVWVCWRFYQDIRAHHTEAAADAMGAEGYRGPPRRTLQQALVVITMADISMSIDNIIAVAAIARENTSLLIFGLVLSIAFMALCATMIMRIMMKYAWLSWAGLLFLVYLASNMLIDGWAQIVESIA